MIKSFFIVNLFENKVDNKKMMIYNGSQYRKIIKVREKFIMEQQTMKIQDLTLIALMAALTCILGPMSITLPFTPVPISFTNLVIYFAVMVIGMKRGTISYLVYLLIGAVGLPVFSGFSGWPTNIHSNFPWMHRYKFFFLSCQCIVDFHFSFSLLIASEF